MFELLISLKEKIDEGLGNFKLPDPAGDETKPRIFIGDLPRKRSSPEQQKDFPYIVIIPISGEDDVKSSSITVSFLVGVYTNEKDNNEVSVINYVSNLINKIRSIVLKNPISAKKYRMIHPLTWELGVVRELGQIKPYGLGEITTTWMIDHIEEHLTML